MNRLTKQAQLFFKRNAPTILTCAGAVGVVTTAVLTAKATPKAQQLLLEATKEKGENLTKSESVIAAAPAYIPAVISGAATIACIFGANILNKQSQAALISAYALLDNSYKEYKQKLIELHGEEIDAEIKHALAQGKYEDLEFIDDQRRLFFDWHSLRYFESTLEDVHRAECRFNRNYNLDGYACLNDFYDALGLPRTEDGYELGWSVFSEDPIQIPFIHDIKVMEDGTEVTIISLPAEPNLGYIY